MSLPSPANPFEESADPRGYVPRAACDEVLGSLERYLEAGVPVIVLRGPAGIGKSMLLSVLHQSVAEAWRVAQVAVSPSPSVEISHRILDLLDVDVDTDPSSTLVATARRFALSGQRVLVIIDPATHVPVASSRQLARAAARAGGDLCVLFAVTEGESAEAFEREIGAEAEFATVRFDTPMNAQETSEYIARRLDETLGSQALHDRFDEAAFRYVIEGASGNPRQVNELAYDALNRLERGDPLPVREPAPEASAGFATEAPASPPADSLLPRGPSTYVDPPHPGHSLGGGLLGAGPARDPREFDAARELFPPGFLRSDRDPLPPLQGPASDGAGAPGDPGDAARVAADRVHERAPERSDSMPDGAAAGRAASVEEEAAVEGAAAVERESVAEGAAAADGVTAAEREAAPDGAIAIERDAVAEVVAAFDGEAASQGAVAAASTMRLKLGVAVLIVVAAAGGYLAGRVDPVPIESSPPPAALPAAAPTQVALDAESISPEPPASPVRPERSGLDALNRPPAVASTMPAAESAPPPTAASGSGSSLADAKPGLATPSRPDEVSAGSAPQPTGEANRLADSAPPVAVQAVAPSVEPDLPKPIPTPPSPAPSAEPRAEDTRVVSGSSARSQPSPPRGPAPDSPVAEGSSIADGSVTAIVVGARGTGESRASAYVRVRVQLEAGAILSIDGEPVGVAPFSDLIMEPGLHTFVAELPDGLQIEQLVQVTSETGVVEF